MVNVVTNGKNDTLTRPRSFLSRLGALAGGCLLLALSISAFIGEVPILGAILLLAAIGGFMSFTQKYETIGR